MHKSERGLAWNGRSHLLIALKSQQVDSRHFENLYGRISPSTEGNHSTTSISCISIEIVRTLPINGFYQKHQKQISQDWVRFITNGERVGSPAFMNESLENCSCIPSSVFQATRPFAQWNRVQLTELQLAFKGEQIPTKTTSGLWLRSSLALVFVPLTILSALYSHCCAENLSCILHLHFTPLPNVVLKFFLFSTTLYSVQCVQW